MCFCLYNTCACVLIDAVAVWLYMLNVVACYICWQNIDVGSFVVYLRASIFGCMLYMFLHTYVLESFSFRALGMRACVPCFYLLMNERAPHIHASHNFDIFLLFLVLGGY
jgi:hypothetical protein